MSAKKQDSKELVELLRFTDGIREKANPITRRWNDFYRKADDFIYDNQLQDKTRGKGHQWIQFNKMYPAFAQEMAVQLNRKTTLATEPVEDDDAIGAEVWGSILQHYYDKVLRFDERLRTAATLDAKSCGIFIAKPYWDPKVRWNDKDKKWEGDVRCNIVKPHFFGVDPEAEDYIDYSDCEFVLIESRIALDVAQRQYPDFKEELKDAAGLRPEDDPLGDGGRRVGFVEANLNIETVAKDKGRVGQEERGDFINLVRNKGMRHDSDGDTGPKYVTITEIIFRDRSEKEQTEEEFLQIAEYPEGSIKKVGQGHEVVDTKVFHEAGHKNVKKGDKLERGIMLKRVVRRWMEPEFPLGRKVLRANDIILNPKKEDQRYPYKRWDFILGINLPLPHNIRGLNSVEMARGLQNWLNVGASSLASYLMLMGSPITIIEEGTLAKDPGTKKASKLVRAAGAVWKVVKGGRERIKQLDPPRLDPTALNVFNMVAEQLQDMTGGQNVSLGKATPGEQTGTEVAVLAENAAQRQSLPAKLMDMWTIRVFEHIFDLLKTHKSEGDIVRIVGDQFKNKVVQLKGERQEPEVDTEGKPVIGPGGQPVTKEVKSDFDIEFDLKLHVVDASPFSKMARKQEARELLETLGNITGGVNIVALNNLLDVTEAPNKEDILKEVQQSIESQSNAAQEAAQQELSLEDRELDIKQETVDVKREAQRDKSAKENEGGKKQNTNS